MHINYIQLIQFLFDVKSNISDNNIKGTPPAKKNVFFRAIDLIWAMPEENIFLQELLFNIS